MVGDSEDLGKRLGGVVLRERSVLGGKGVKSEDGEVFCLEEETYFRAQEALRTEKGAFCFEGEVCCGTRQALGTEMGCSFLSSESELLFTWEALFC